MTIGGGTEKTPEQWAAHVAITLSATTYSGDNFREVTEGILRAAFARALASRDAEIARLKGEANDASASLARIMECIADDGTRIAVGVLDQRIREADAEIARLKADISADEANAWRAADAEREALEQTKARVAQLETGLAELRDDADTPAHIRIWAKSVLAP